MNAILYRAILAASLVVGLLAVAADMFLPVNDAFRDAQQAHEASLSGVRLLAIAVTTVIGSLLLVASTYGLFTFKRWARRAALTCTVLSLLLVAAVGTFAQSGVSASLSYLGSYLWGAVVVLTYVPPIAPLFEKHES
jgi:hypothetical protein